MNPDTRARHIIHVALAVLVGVLLALLLRDALAGPHDSGPLIPPATCVEVPCTAAEIEQRKRWSRQDAERRLQRREQAREPAVREQQRRQYPQIICLQIEQRTQCVRVAPLIGA